MTSYMDAIMNAITGYNPNPPLARPLKPAAWAPPGPIKVDTSIKGDDAGTAVAPPDPTVDLSAAGGPDAPTGATGSWGDPSAPAKPPAAKPSTKKAAKKTKAAASSSGADATTTSDAAAPPADSTTGPIGAIPRLAGMTDKEYNDLGLGAYYESDFRPYVPNYLYGAPGRTAGGLFQITDQNWNHYAQGMNIQSRTHPGQLAKNAMDASPEDQTRVADALYKERGMQPWADFNPRLARALAHGEKLQAPPAGGTGGGAPAGGGDPSAGAAGAGGAAGGGTPSDPSGGNVNQAIYDQYSQQMDGAQGQTSSGGGGGQSDLERHIEEMAQRIGPQSSGIPFLDKLTNILNNPLMQGALSSYFGAISAPKHTSAAGRLGIGGLAGLKGFSEAEQQQTALTDQELKAYTALEELPLKDAQRQEALAHKDLFQEQANQLGPDPQTAHTFAMISQDKSGRLSPDQINLATIIYHGLQSGKLKTADALKYWQTGDLDAAKKQLMGAQTTEATAKAQTEPYRVEELKAQAYKAWQEAQHAGDKNLESHTLVDPNNPSNFVVLPGIKGQPFVPPDDFVKAGYVEKETLGYTQKAFELQQPKVSGGMYTVQMGGWTYSAPTPAKGIASWFDSSGGGFLRGPNGQLYSNQTPEQAKEIIERDQAARGGGAAAPPNAVASGGGAPAPAPAAPPTVPVNDFSETG